MHYHLDPIGGVAGDMFAAAMLDYRRDWQAALPQVIRDSGLAFDLSVRALEHNDGILSGRRFEVTETAELDTDQHHHWCDIRKRLSRCKLEASVKQRAMAIFKLLAEAEADVHGVAVDEVAFHEVGARDSIADIVAAAWLIEHSEASGWSCSPIPLGQGRIASAHGLLPVLAPATAVLLRGFPVYKDGVEGERVTPTGAAILRHLEPSFNAHTTPSVLLGCGYGFGTKKFPGFSNVLQISVFDPLQSESANNDIAVCQFEVDDQTPEDLAVGLERLRELPNVFDVTQAPVFGKKGRLAMQIQVLGQVSKIDAILDHCLTETTTLGVRWHIANRKTLAREVHNHMLIDDQVRVKRAERPGDMVTRKVEMADLAQVPGGHAGREQRRREAYIRDLEDEGGTPSNPELESGQ